MVRIKHSASKYRMARVKPVFPSKGGKVAHTYICSRRWEEYHTNSQVYPHFMFTYMIHLSTSYYREMSSIHVLSV